MGMFWISLTYPFYSLKRKYNESTQRRSAIAGLSVISLSRRAIFLCVSQTPSRSQLALHPPHPPLLFIESTHTPPRTVVISRARMSGLMCECVACVGWCVSAVRAPCESLRGRVEHVLDDDARGWLDHGHIGHRGSGGCGRGGWGATAHGGEHRHVLAATQLGHE